jgi:DNA-binding NarL/FixJ family response regulator
LQIHSLDQFDSNNQAWREVLVEHRQAGPAETASARIDIAAWLGSLSERKRQLAEALCQGEKTSNIATVFQLSPGRISQLRQELRQSWESFHGN